jgi:hypothetical protein
LVGIVSVVVSLGTYGLVVVAGVLIGQLVLSVLVKAHRLFELRNLVTQTRHTP